MKDKLFYPICQYIDIETRPVIMGSISKQETAVNGRFPSQEKKTMSSIQPGSKVYATGPTEDDLGVGIVQSVFTG